MHRVVEILNSEVDYRICGISIGTALMFIIFALTAI
jgi:hypothetical protein